MRYSPTKEPQKVTASPAMPSPASSSSTQAYSEGEIAQSAEVHAAVEHGPEATASVVAEHGFKGSSQALPYQSEMEARFGQRFEHIQAYRGGPAREASTHLNANAYAVGDRVAFRDESPSRFVVAHELAHTIQQGGGSEPVVQALSPDGAGQHEAEANSAAEAVERGEQANVVLSSPVGIQRNPFGNLINGIKNLAKVIRYKRTANSVNRTLQAFDNDRIGKGPAMGDMLDAMEGLTDPFDAWNRVPTATRNNRALEAVFFETVAIDKQRAELEQELFEAYQRPMNEYYELLRGPIYTEYERRARQVMDERLAGEDSGPSGLGTQVVLQTFVTNGMVQVQRAWAEEDKTRAAEILRSGLTTTLQPLFVGAGANAIAVSLRHLGSGERARYQSGEIKLSISFAEELVSSPDDMGKAREVLKAVIHEAKHHEQTPEEMKKDYGHRWFEARDPRNAGTLAAAIGTMEDVLERAKASAWGTATNDGPIRATLIRKLREDGVDQGWAFLRDIEDNLINGVIRQAEDNVRAAYRAYRENAYEWDAHMVGDLTAMIFDIQTRIHH